MSTHQIEHQLAVFKRTESRHRFSPIYKDALLTDGAKYLAENGNAFWLMNLICSHQLNTKVRNQPFQVWMLKKHSKGDCMVTCDDGNGQTVSHERLVHTDFPMDMFYLYAIWNNQDLVIMLPSEYDR